MYFTQEDYKKIEAWLYQRTVKDTEFPKACPIKGTEDIPIIQDRKNKLIGFNDFIEEIVRKSPSDFYNVNAVSKTECLSLEDAIALIPEDKKRLGLVITFKNKNKNWLIYQFKGCSLNQWDSVSCWDNIIQEALDELIFWPDEEDITFVQKDNKKLLKFKDRLVDPEQFISKGMIILRKDHIEGSESCAIDDEDHLINVLTQEDINKANTIYVIKYDFDLKGKTINIPENSVLWFQGGSLNNGTINLNNTAVLGAFEFSDMGDCTITGTFNTGQVMTFINSAYNKKNGDCFYSGVIDSRLNTFTPGDFNTHVYGPEKRQELRWWNGEEWILLMDITDYDELKSTIEDLVEKHNSEVSMIFQYFINRYKSIETRLNTVESTIEDHEGRLISVEELSKETADKLRIFLEDRDVQDATINRWKELEDFLAGITDTETLTGLLEKLKSDLSKEIEAVKKLVESKEDKFTPGEGLEMTEDRVLNNTFKNEAFIICDTLPPKPDEGNESKIHYVRILDTLWSITLPKLSSTLPRKLEEILCIGVVELIEYTDSSAIPHRTVYIPILLQYGSNETYYLRGTAPTGETFTGNYDISTSIFTYDITNTRFYLDHLIFKTDWHSPDYVDYSSYVGYIYIEESKHLKGHWERISPSQGATRTAQAVVKTSEITSESGSSQCSITVNKETYWPDSTGNITLPDYPTIPDTAGTVDKVANKLKFTGASTAEYDGSKEVTINIPSPTDTTFLELRVKTLEDNFALLQEESVKVINLEPGQDTIQITVNAVDIEGNPKDVNYSVSSSDNITVE